MELLNNPISNPISTLVMCLNALTVTVLIMTVLSIYVLTETNPLNSNPNCLTPALIHAFLFHSFPTLPVPSRPISHVPSSYLTLGVLSLHQALTRLMMEGALAQLYHSSPPHWCGLIRCRVHPSGPVPDYRLLQQ